MALFNGDFPGDTQDPYILPGFDPQHMVHTGDGRWKETRVPDDGAKPNSKPNLAHLLNALREYLNKIEHQPDKVAKIVLYAHGGLVSAEDGATNAQKLKPYFDLIEAHPIFFLWESAFDTVGNNFDEYLYAFVKEAVTRAVIEQLTGQALTFFARFLPRDQKLKFVPQTHIKVGKKAPLTLDVALRTALTDNAVQLDQTNSSLSRQLRQLHEELVQETRNHTGVELHQAAQATAHQWETLTDTERKDLTKKIITKVKSTQLEDLQKDIASFSRQLQTMEKLDLLGQCGAEKDLLYSLSAQPRDQRLDALTALALKPELQQTPGFTFPRITVAKALNANNPTPLQNYWSALTDFISNINVTTPDTKPKWLKTVIRIIGQVILNLKDGVDDDLHDVIVQEIIHAFPATQFLAKTVWQEMKNDTRQHFHREGAGELVLHQLNAMLKSEFPKVPVHLYLVGHSAGSVFHCHLLQHLNRKAEKEPGFLDVPVTLIYLAPACTMDLFHDTLQLKRTQHLLQRGRNNWSDPAGILNTHRINIFGMEDQYERKEVLVDGVPWFFHGSLLYFVSRCCEPQSDTPLLGMQRYHEHKIFRQQNMNVRQLLSRLKKPDVNLVWSVTASTAPARSRSEAKEHGNFDLEDKETLESMRAIIQDV